MPYYKNCAKICIFPGRKTRKYRKCTKAFKCKNKLRARRKYGPVGKCKLGRVKSGPRKGMCKKRR